MHLVSKMEFIIKFIAFLLLLCSVDSIVDCRNFLEESNAQTIEWSQLKDCLAAVNDYDMSIKMKENIWKLTKLAFGNVDTIPSDAFKFLNYALTAVPIKDLQNISMDNVDVVEAFGAIRNEKDQMNRNGFSQQQLSALAAKVRNEWFGKNPQTYSEYDLMTMGEILCFLNVTDIEEIHADAFKEAAEHIGLIEQCPQDRLQALANLAKRPDAFGEPQRWTKLEVTIIGNILNGLSAMEISSIDNSKLQLNNFYNSKNSVVQAQIQSNLTQNPIQNLSTTSAQNESYNGKQRS